MRSDDVTKTKFVELFSLLSPRPVSPERTGQKKSSC